MGLLLLTSVGGQGEPDAARRAGLDAYLTKPVRPTQLLDALAGLLERNATRRQASSAAPVPGLASPGASILVVDDNAVNRAVIVGMLEAYACITSEAQDGDVAARQWQRANHLGDDHEPSGSR